MPPADGAGRAPLRLSVIVPFHRNLAHLRPCLAGVRRALSALPPDVRLADLIVAADGATEDLGPVAAEAGARVLAMAGPKGPAVARSAAAAVATGDLLVFIDADVVVREQALACLASLFLVDPDLGAAFGAYDEEPADAGFFSQCRNLAHSFIHQRASRQASTFWAGLGAVRAAVFDEVGGFDPRFAQPSVEDIDLGYRICRAGYRIEVEPAVQGTHLKRWTFWSSIVSDVRDRGVPWTQLLTRYRSMRNDLNLARRYRVAVVLAYVLAGSAAASVVWPGLLILALAAAGSLWWLDRAYYRFFASRRGLAFTAAWFPFHVVHHLCNGVSFLVGTVLYAGQRWAGVTLPGALPVTPWSPRHIR